MTSRSRSVATPSPFSSSDSNSIEQEQPHLSARAYVGSLVKQLSSSPSAARSKAQHLHTMSSSDQHQLPRQGHDEQAPALKPQMKKQTRRRVHTIRPYQERLLNMAEARREIVTALRIHRANMRQQSKYQQEQQRQRPRLQQPAVQVIFQEQSQAFEGVLPVATNYASAAADNHLCSSPFANLVAGAPSGNYSSSMLSYDLAPLQEEAPAAVGGLEQLVCNLPAQPLGLNLSFQGFDGASLDKANKNSDDPFGVPLIQPSSPCPAAASYSAYSSPVTAMAGHRYSSANAPAELSQVLDGEVEMSYSIGSGGERQGTELMSETTAANVGAASAWWTKMLESMESGGETAGAEVGKQADDMVVGAGRSEWLCDGVGVGVEQDVAAGPKPEIMETMHVFDGDYSGYYEGDHGDNGGDIALQCVDVEGWDDGEWFS